MKKSIFLRAFLVSLIFCILLPLLAPTFVSAASGSASIGLSSRTVYVGNYVYVTVTYSADKPMATWSFGVQYDTSRLKYVSGAHSTTGGTLNFVDQPTSGGVSSKSYTITFQTIALGEASVSTITREVYAEDYSSISVSNASRTISIVEKPAASGENRLSSLSAEGVVLSPAFDRDTTTYTASVPYSVDELTFTTATVHASASVYVTGADDLAVGENEVRITVTAENSSTRTYVVKVTRKDSDYVGAKAEISGKKYVFARDPSEVEKLPAGFAPSEGTYQGQNVLLFANAAKSAVLAVLFEEGEKEGELGKAQLFLYDAEGERFLPYLSVETLPQSFIFLTPGEKVEVPEGFSESSLVVFDNEIIAWENSPEDGEESVTLVYATPVDGEAAFYAYDAKEGTFTLYRSAKPTLSSDGKTMEEMEAALSASEAREAETRLRWMQSVVLLGAVCLLLFLLVIILAILAARRKKKLKKQTFAAASAPAFVPAPAPIPVRPVAEEPFKEATDEARVPTRAEEAAEEPLKPLAVPPIASEEDLPELDVPPAAPTIPIWEELRMQARDLDEEEDILAPSRQKREVSSPPPAASVPNPRPQGHPEVERIFGTPSEDELFRRNNPIIDEDEEDGGDAPVFGFDE